jgi:glycosyltransferase involved in cell wall biosynthesis
MESNQKRIRVLMIGPGERIISGISALTETIVPVLKQQVDLLYISTVEQRPLTECGKFSWGNIALALSQYVRCLGALVRFQPNIIHLHTSHGIGWLKDSYFVLIGKAFGCHIVLHVHGGNFDEIYAKSFVLVQYYTRGVMSLVDAVITVSADWKRRLAGVVPVERLHAFRNCIAVDTFGPRSGQVVAENAKALFLGRVGQPKGAFDLLEAMSRLKSSGCPLYLWLSGDEERDGDWARAQTRLEELQLENICQVVGIVRGPKKAQLLNEASMFVLPSYYEGLPMALLEALAAGLPVVATPVGGVPEVIKDGYNGFLVHPGDVEALTEKLAILTNDQHLREMMGRRGREIAEQELDVKPYVNRLVALYKSLAGPGTKQLDPS